MTNKLSSDIIDSLGKAFVSATEHNGGVGLKHTIASAIKYANEAKTVDSGLAEAAAAHSFNAALVSKAKDMRKGMAEANAIGGGAGVLKYLEACLNGLEVSGQ